MRGLCHQQQTGSAERICSELGREDLRSSPGTNIPHPRDQPHVGTIASIQVQIHGLSFPLPRAPQRCEATYSRPSASFGDKDQSGRAEELICSGQVDRMWPCWLP